MEPQNRKKTISKDCKAIGRYFTKGSACKQKRDAGAKDKMVPMAKELVKINIKVNWSK